VAFESVWRASPEYGLGADWPQPALWFCGERLNCDRLAFGNADALSRLNPGAPLRTQGASKRWAAANLVRDE